MADKEILKRALEAAQNALEVHAGHDQHSLPALNQVDRALNALDGGWRPTHQHRKGGRYRELMRGFREHDLEPIVIYEGEDGTVWSRPAAAFDDGRFSEIRT